MASTIPLTEPAEFQRRLSASARTEWVVYAKPPFGGPGQVLKYLARYTHRVAISNARIVAVADGAVTFRYKDYADDHRSKVMTLSAVEFLRRFVQHVLPSGFVKVRSYGLLSNRFRACWPNSTGNSRTPVRSAVKRRTSRWPIPPSTRLWSVRRSTGSTPIVR